jgi:cytochrome c553
MAKARTRRRDLAKTLAAVAAVTALSGCDIPRHGSMPIIDGAQNRATGKLHTCAACHGDQGVSRAEIFPNLAGQQKDYIAAELTAFRDHTRQDRDAKTYMWGYAARLDPATIEDFAAYYAEQKPAGPAAAGSKTEVAAGEAIFKNGVADRGVLACAACHGDRGEGNAEIPRLAGQHRDYVMVQLKAFASGARENGTMSLVAKAMTPADIKAVATYVASAS